MGQKTLDCCGKDIEFTQSHWSEEVIPDSYDNCEPDSTISNTGNTNSCQLSRIHREHHGFYSSSQKFLGSIVSPRFSRFLKPFIMALTDTNGIVATSVIIQQQNVKSLSSQRHCFYTCFALDIAYNSHIYSSVISTSAFRF